jgi:hypothetical protein
MTLALYWAVSTGHSGAVSGYVGGRACRSPRRKKALDAAPKKVARSLTSFFKRGLRRIQICLERLRPLPALWSIWRN